MDSSVGQKEEAEEVEADKDQAKQPSTEMTNPI